MLCISRFSWLLYLDIYLMEVAPTAHAFRLMQIYQLLHFSVKHPSWVPAMLAFSIFISQYYIYLIQGNYISAFLLWHINKRHIQSHLGTYSAHMMAHMMFMAQKVTLLSSVLHDIYQSLYRYLWDEISSDLICRMFIKNSDDSTSF